MTNGRRILASIVCMALFAGCTTIPKSELSQYKTAFEQTRTAGETVLLDFGAARKKFEQLQEEAARQKETATTGKSLEEEIGLTFDVKAISASAQKIDSVAIRLQTWEVVSSYNKALVALAEGHSPEEVSTTVNGLVDALKKFPVKDIAKVAADATPYLSALEPIIEAIEREITARKFKAAVLKGSPTVDHFIDLLTQDVQQFWNVRRELLLIDYRHESRLVADKRSEFFGLVRSTDWNEKSTVFTESDHVNKARLRLFGGERIPEITPVKGTKELNPQNEVLLTELSSQIDEKTDAALAKIRELKAFQEVVTRYAVLLEQLKANVQGLRDAVAQGHAALPSAAELQTIVGSVRQAYEIYQKSK